MSVVDVELCCEPSSFRVLIVVGVGSTYLDDAQSRVAATAIFVAVLHNAELLFIVLIK